MVLPWWLSGKESAHSAGNAGVIPGLWRFPGGGNGTHSSTLACEIPWTEQSASKELDMTEQRNTHTKQKTLNVFIYCLMYLKYILAMG